MKKLVLFFSIALLTSIVIGCNDKKNTTKNNTVNDSLNKNTQDSTMYVTCMEGAMHSIVALNSAGDTINFILETPDTVADVQGGMFNGDKLAIICEKTPDGLFAKKVINLTSLKGKWTSIDKNFEIKDGGAVSSYVESETKPYTSWKIHNGNLILSADTFNVLMLGSDSLYLENNDGIFVYKRQK